MIYLLSQMILALAVAIVLGIALGWIIHRTTYNRLLLKYNHQLNRQSTQLNQAQSDVSTLSDEYDELKHQSLDEINALRSANEQIAPLTTNLEKSQLLVQQMMTRHEGNVRDLKSKNQLLQTKLNELRVQIENNAGHAESTDGHAGHGDDDVEETSPEIDGLEPEVKRSDEAAKPDNARLRVDESREEPVELDDVLELPPNGDEEPAELDGLELRADTTYAPVESAEKSKTETDNNDPVALDDPGSKVETGNDPVELDDLELKVDTDNAPVELDDLELEVETDNAPVELDDLELKVETDNAPVEFDGLESMADTDNAPVKLDDLESMAETVNAPVEFDDLESKTETLNDPAELDGLKLEAETNNAPIELDALEANAETNNDPAELDVLKLKAEADQEPTEHDDLELTTLSNKTQTERDDLEITAQSNETTDERDDLELTTHSSNESAEHYNLELTAVSNQETIGLGYPGIQTQRISQDNGLEKWRSPANSVAQTPTDRLSSSAVPDLPIASIQALYAAAESEDDPFDDVMEVADELQRELDDTGAATLVDDRPDNVELFNSSSSAHFYSTDSEQLDDSSANVELTTNESSNDRAFSLFDDTATLFDPVNHQDDLQQIFGIGPLTERALNDLGITSYSQLADLKQHDIQRIADALEIGASRIERDNWVGNARRQLEEVLEQL